MLRVLSLEHFFFPLRSVRWGHFLQSGQFLFEIRKCFRTHFALLEMTSLCPCCKKNQQHPELSADGHKWYFVFIQPWRDTFAVLDPVLGYPVQVKGYRGGDENWSIWHLRRAESWDYLTSRREGSGELHACKEIPDCAEEWARFLVIPGGWTRCSQHQLKHRKFLLKVIPSSYVFVLLFVCVYVSMAEQIISRNFLLLFFSFCLWEC